MTGEIYQEAGSRLGNKVVDSDAGFLRKLSKGHNQLYCSVKWPAVAGGLSEELEYLTHAPILLWSIGGVNHD